MADPIDPTADVTKIDLGVYADPDAQVILLDRASGRDAGVLAAIQAELRREQDCGWCRILHMSDEIAVVRWFDQFILTITDRSLAMIDGGGNG